MSCLRASLFHFLVAMAVFAGVDRASCRDHVLTIGGGFSPAGNQVSLERNVLFFGNLVAERLPAGTEHDLYFADGDSPQRDLQFRVAGEEVPRSNRLMAGLFGSEDDLENHYRDNELEGVRGASSPGELERWFAERGAQLRAGDRLILYITAHGGRSGDKDNQHNTRIWMWNRQSIDAAKLAGLIGGLPEGVKVVTVMVQCFSGGFSHLLFEGNDAKRGDSGRDLCGFFATVCDREAAGCTSDVNEENYDEYSSHFWAAMRGTTRLGEPVTAADHDGDGVASFEEAHAHAILTSRNIDVPVKTSDAFLRVHGKLRSGDDPELLGLETGYGEILALARPVERAVLEGLSAQLSLDGAGRGVVARAEADRLEAELKALEERQKEQKKALEGVRDELARDLRNRWPELENRHSPGAIALLAEAGRSAEFVEAVEAHPRFAEWERLKRERAELEAEELRLSKRYATHRRFVRALENVAYAANLAREGDGKGLARYRELLAAEQGGL